MFEGSRGIKIINHIPIMSLDRALVTKLPGIAAQCPNHLLIIQIISTN